MLSPEYIVCVALNLKLSSTPVPLGRQMGKEQFNADDDNDRQKFLLHAGTWTSLCESQVTSAGFMIGENSKMEIRIIAAW